MAMYRKKPVVIEAMEFTNDSKDQVYNFISCNRYADYEGDNPALRIQTLEGEITASLGDFIIKGIQGEFYPCKPDIFHKTYDLQESE